MTKDNTWVIRRAVKRTLGKNLKTKLIFTLLSVSLFVGSSALIYGWGKNISLSPIAYAMGETSNSAPAEVNQPIEPFVNISNGVIIPVATNLDEPKVTISVGQSNDEKEAQITAQKEAAKKRAEVIARSTPKRVDFVAKGDVQKLAEQKVDQTWGDSQWSAFNIIVQKESGWVVGNKNRHSGACGLGQALPCSKMGSAYGNAAGEIDWTINYISNRYGTPSIALAHHRSYGWY